MKITVRAKARWGGAALATASMTSLTKQHEKRKVRTEGCSHVSDDQRWSHLVNRKSLLLLVQRAPTFFTLVVSRPPEVSLLLCASISLAADSRMTGVVHRYHNVPSFRGSGGSDRIKIFPFDLKLRVIGTIPHMNTLNSPRELLSKDLNYCNCAAFFLNAALVLCF